MEFANFQAIDSALYHLPLTPVVTVVSMSDEKNFPLVKTQVLVENRKTNLQIVTPLLA